MLRREGGEPFFWLADTAWELFHRYTPADAARYLETRAAQGFTVVQAVLLAEEAPDRTRVTVTSEPHGEATAAEIDAFARERAGLEEAVLGDGGDSAIIRLEGAAVGHITSIAV